MDRNYSKLSFKDISYDVANLKEINFFCINRILINLLKFFFTHSLKDIYLKSLVETHSPKIIISNDREEYSFKIKNLCKNIFCITYQHSYYDDYDKKFLKEYLIGKTCDLFVTYHTQDTEFLSKIVKSEYISLGSIKNNEIILEKGISKEIPLLLISEFRENAHELHTKKLIETCNYVKEFAKKKDIIPHVALSANRADKGKYNLLNKELKFYKKYLDKFEWKNENSLITANKTNLCICLHSNLGIELLSRGFKTIFLNLIGDVDKNQINPYLIIKKPNYFLINCNKQEINSKLEYYFNLSQSEWQNESDLSSNSIHFDEGNISFKKEIKKILDNEKNK